MQKKIRNIESHTINLSDRLSNSFPNIPFTVHYKSANHLQNLGLLSTQVNNLLDDQQPAPADAGEISFRVSFCVCGCNKARVEDSYTRGGASRKRSLPRDAGKHWARSVPSAWSKTCVLHHQLDQARHYRGEKCQEATSASFATQLVFELACSEMDQLLCSEPSNSIQLIFNHNRSNNHLHYTSTLTTHSRCLTFFFLMTNQRLPHLSTMWTCTSGFGNCAGQLVPKNHELNAHLNLKTSLLQSKNQ